MLSLLQSLSFQNLDLRLLQAIAMRTELRLARDGGRDRALATYGSAGISLIGCILQSDKPANLLLY